MGTPEGEVTQLLHAWGGGDRSVEDRLFELVLPDLRKLAENMLRRERPDHSLQPTALLNEAYCRLLTARERDWRSRSHFFAIAARAMRRLLIEHARGRPKGARIPIDGLQEFLRGRDEQLELALAVDGLLDDMAPAHASWCSIVELKFFLGFTDEEAAEVLGLPLRSLQRQFGDARRWLYEKLKSCQAKPNTTSS
jgi:RNA polymerase sigma factor (TIGR02999 family)